MQSAFINIPNKLIKGKIIENNKRSNEWAINDLIKNAISLKYNIDDANLDNPLIEDITLNREENIAKVLFKDGTEKEYSFELRASNIEEI